METTTQIPKCTIVGAGPGDPDLLTLKAVKALNQASVVLYDALVNPKILEHAQQAEKIFVGKRKGCHHYAQQQINELIVAMAKEKGAVVRLKGGDPFVFGRGSEERNYAQEHGVEVDIISGISSAIAVPTAVGIPVTQRHTAESFWVITGTTSGHKLSRDLAEAAKTSATVVVLMGMGKLDEIIALYKKENKSELPIAVVQNGTLGHQKVVAGTISNIKKCVQAQKLATPAIMVIGEVVKASQSYQDYLKGGELNSVETADMAYSEAV